MALRNLRQRMLSSCLTSLLVGLGVALAVTVLLLEREARSAFSGTAVGVEVLVGGNKGSRIDTLLSALYHVGRAPGRIAWPYYEKISRDRRVAYAVPLAIGDRYRGSPLVGTTEAFFTRFKPRPGLEFEVDGETIAGGRRRAVVGAVAARRTGLALGDRFYPSHTGLDGDHTHEGEVFTVVGMARPTGTAHDKAIWVDIHDFIALAGHRGLARREEVDAISAILVKTKSGSPLIVEPLIKEINDGTEAQAIRPMQVVGELFALAGTAYRVLGWIATLVIVVAATAVMVSLYNTMADRRREIAILRALGAGRGHVFSAILIESALLCTFGALLGLLLGHGGAALAAPIVEARAGVRLGSAGLLPEEPLLLLALFLLGVAAGVVPALTAYRTDVAKGLD